LLSEVLAVALVVHEDVQHGAPLVVETAVALREVLHDVQHGAPPFFAGLDARFE
jgi:hypothetical protein